MSQEKEWSLFERDPSQYKEELKIPFFADKCHEVKHILRTDKLMPEERIDFEVDWFFAKLGIDKNYFQVNSSAEIANHILSLYAAKCLSHTNGTDLELKLQSSSHSGKVMFVSRSSSTSSNRKGPQPSIAVEQEIEYNYLGQGYEKSTNRHQSDSQPQRRWKLQSYRTSGSVSPSYNVHLRLYFLNEPQFKESKPHENETDMDKISDIDFLRKFNQWDPNTQNRYREVVTQAVTQIGPVIRIFDTHDDQEKQLIVAHRAGTTHSFFSAVTDLYHSWGFFSRIKFVEQFSNGITMYTIYLKSTDNSWNETLIHQLKSNLNLIYILPRTSLSHLFRNGTLSCEEHAYAYAAWKFSFQFLSRQSTEFAEISEALKSDPSTKGLLEQIKKSVRKEAYTEGRILTTILEHVNLIKELYSDFENYHRPSNLTARPKPHANEDILKKIKKVSTSELDEQILRAFVTFNSHTLRTNFFKTSKTALSFRMDPSFLSKAEYQVTPFGLFYVVGAEFRGFHIRFRDIARGGIRIIKSINLQAFSQNVTTLFDENYNLAATQERKNKDIPEGGSKGTILLSLDHQDKAFPAFQQYIDALLDLLLCKKEPEIVDHYKQEEILFCGPDEGTADYMNWASQHAKERGFPFWKAFTTGKSRERGGIPHDLYGMTTRSIHQYVLGILHKLNLKEENCTKFQTGGPDGDLGSNEIKISKDKTIGVVDGSGVLYDPEGINRQELVALATARKMVRFFDRTKLSPQGFYVDVDQTDVTLPDGTLVQSGLSFRNTFHLNERAKGDIFVPCGGRPEAINLSNVNMLIDKESKKTRFKYIVEGANLFFTQEARLVLENHGVVIFKDASANKGGVTSSSLEVLAALSMSDTEFEEHMMVKNNVEPKFYAEYVQEVQHFIEENARLEFECLWKEHEISNIPRSILSDTVSNKINELSLSIHESDLWNNLRLRENVLKEAIPQTLQKLLGLEMIVKRIPEQYARAIFSGFLASRYVYQFGLATNSEFSFFQFVFGYISK